MSEPPANTVPPKDAPVADPEGDKGPSKNALKKAAKEAEKAKKAAERAAKEAEQAAARAAADIDYAEQNYGKLPLNQSQERPGRVRAQISTFNASNDGEHVVLRARVHTSRAQGSKMVFFALRQRQHTVQALLTVAPETVSKQMVKWAASVPLESIVLVEGLVKRSPEEIKGATIKDAEVHITKIHTISEPESRLPFNLEDADKAQGDEREVPTVSFDTRLNNRVLDLRTQTSQSIFIMQSAVTDLFRQSLQAQGFIEIHSPKLQGAATESGSSVFKVDYFKGKAFLAQSPQLAKQMAIGADFERVYEIGPVFRAENSFTHRHLTEFTGLDLEMTIEEHYHEVMDVLDSMLLHIFNGLKTKFSADIEAVRKVYPSTEFTWLEKTLRLQWKDAIALLRENGVTIGDFDDINTETEKFLGKLVKDKYNTDYYILDKFPLALRPFYTMPDPVDPNYSNSYDFFMRGEEILSGAQRVHDAKMLEKRMVEVGIDPKDMQGYLDGFRMGIAPHGGGGIGLERVVMLFLKLGNIRNASLFPRDPKRLEP
ncbi:aspartate-tRNA ligase [Rhizoctonia solani]|nr:aspartate-tRNA ligase [Rhizoctonia solani]